MQIIINYYLRPIKDGKYPKIKGLKINNFINNLII